MVCAAATAIGFLAVNPGVAQISNTSKSAGARTLVVADQVDYLGGRAREPMVVQHPDGTLFASGFALTADELGPKLWKSQDLGKTWTRANVGTAAEGAVGNSDVSLAVAPDGTLYFATMGPDIWEPDVSKRQNTIAVGVTKDGGATWRWTVLSKLQSIFGDRPWVAVTSDGVAHIIWNDGSGVDHRVSTDQGNTWTQRPRIYGQGGSSHIAAGPHGELAVRITPASASGRRFDAGVDMIAVSNEGGRAWQRYVAPSHLEWTAGSSFPPLWVEPLAWDAKGALYSFWADGKDLRLARSLDKGENWTTWRVATGEEVSYYPYLIAKGRGELVASWFSGRGDSLKANVARIDASDAIAPPKVTLSSPFQLDCWQAGARPEDPQVRYTGGEYLATTFLKEGGLAVVSCILNPRERRFGFSWRRFEVR
jgi:hypothetical protein